MQYETPKKQNKKQLFNFITVPFTIQPKLAQHTGGQDTVEVSRKDAVKQRIACQIDNVTCPYWSKLKHLTMENLVYLLAEQITQDIKEEEENT